MTFFKQIAALVGFSLCIHGVWAQNYPNKPIKVIVGYAAGGAVDVVARTIGQSISGPLGQAVVIENKPGAGTNIAVKAVITAEPDGYTLMMAANALAANMSLYQPAPFDAERDLVAVSLIGRVPVVIAANPNAPFSNAKQLIDAAKGKPNSIAYGSPGNGSTPHMAIELFARAAGIDLQHVPYRGGSPAITDVIGGQLPLVAVNALEVLPHVKSGKVRALAVTTPKPTPLAGDLPAVASVLPGYVCESAIGLFAPKKTPAAIIKLLATHAQQGVKAADPKITFNNGVEVVASSPEEFARFIKADMTRMGEVIRSASFSN